MKHFHEINMIFWNYVHKFDINDVGILKKIIHTFVVANNCFDVACNLGFDQKDTEFCYIMGIFHDIGRFEQWTKYKTYADYESENHGVIGRRILTSEFTPEQLFLTQEQFDLLADTVQYHVQVYPGNDTTVKTFLPIIHSADAYANLLNVAEGNHVIGNFGDGYTESLYAKLLGGEQVFKEKMNSKLDRLFVSIGNIYCLKFDYMIKEVLDKHYLDKIRDLYSPYLTPEDQIILADTVEHIKNSYNK